jgi:hypothetical protein
MIPALIRYFGRGGRNGVVPVGTAVAPTGKGGLDTMLMLVLVFWLVFWFAFWFTFSGVGVKLLMYEHGR